jgi:hypothetical protein
MVEIDIDARELQKLKKTLLGIKDGVPRVIVPAINRTLYAGQTTIKREVRKQYTIKYSDIPTKVHPANRDPSHGEAGGNVMVEQGMLELNKFAFTPRQPGTRRVMQVQVRKGRRRPIPHGFTQRMPSSGYLGPFLRKGATRLPIKKLYTIGAPIMASQPTVAPEVAKVMGDTLDRRLDHEVERVLNSAGK